MSDSGEPSRKRARKSKLVPRECEYEEEIIKTKQEPELAVQALLPKLRTGLDRDNEEFDNPPPQMEFSINVEVEECEEDLSIYELEDPSDDKVLKQFVIPESVIKTQIKKLSKTTTSLADKQLEIEVKNCYVKFLQPVELTAFENMIQEAINKWRAWNCLSKFRETFFMYKCYHCEVGWWHLRPFLDHIREHEGVKANIEVCYHECNLVGYVMEEDNAMRDVPIEGNCWRCLKSYEEHVALKRKSNMYYFCSACNTNFFTCSAVIEHEGICQRYHKINLKGEVRHENDWECSICLLNCLTKTRYDNHLVGRHSVRSDYVVPMSSPKYCATCDGKYTVYNLHICPRKPDNYQCKYCCRRFQTRHLAALHEKMTTRDYQCRICHIYMKTQCMEMEHMVKHSRNYMLAYKCVLCVETILFPNENSLRRHRLYSHSLKFDKRQGYLERVVVPKKYMLWTNLEKINDVPVAPDTAENPPDTQVSETTPETVMTETKDITEKQHSMEPEIEETHETVEETQEDQPEIGETQKTEEATDIKDEIEEAENAITSLLQKSLNRKRDSIDKGIDDFNEVIIKTEKVKTEKEDYEEFDEQTIEDYKSYEDIDEDIKREEEEYIETLSKVFQASKSVANRKNWNTSFLKEQLMNVTDAVTAKDHAYSREETPKKEIVVIKKYKRSKKLPDTTLLQKELLLTEEAFQASNKNAELIGTSFLQEELTIKEETQELRHITGEEISATSLLQNHQVRNNVFQSSNDETEELQDVETFINQEVMIKEELDDEDYEDDIIVLNESFDATTNSDNCELKLKPQSVAETSIPEIENMSDLGLDKKIFIRVKKKRDKDKGRETRTYKCNTCAFEGPHKQYSEHKLTVCPRKIYLRLGRARCGEKQDKNIWGKYPCSKCGVTYPTMKVYADHFNTKHDLPKGSCPQCSVIILVPSTLISHIIVHIKQSFVKMHMIKESTFVSSKTDGVFQCRECSESVRFRDFFSHWESHMKLREIKEASVCDKEEPTSNTRSKIAPEQLKKVIEQLVAPWDKHKHTSMRSRACSLCGRQFGRRNDVKRHLVEHLLAQAYGDKWRRGALRCQVCDAEFQKADRYKQHMRQHGSLPLYKCELCNRSFSDSSNFAKHKKVHNMRVLVCDVCRKKFQSKAQLERHLEMHRVTQPKPCERCGKLFYSDSSLKKHVRNAHEKDTNRFTCVICRSRFKCLREKWDHMWHVHKERKFKADCPFCDVSFRKFQDVKNHVRDEHNIRLKRNIDETIIMYEYES